MNNLEKMLQFDWDKKFNFEFRMPKFEFRNPVDSIYESIGNIPYSIQVENHNLLPSVKITKFKDLSADDLLRIKRQKEIETQELIEKQEMKDIYMFEICSDHEIDIWAKYPVWHVLDEGVPLILNRNPKKINLEKIKNHITESPFAKKFEEIRETAKRYIACGKLADSIPPLEFLLWAKQLNYEIPTKLLTLFDLMQTDNLQLKLNKLEKKNKKQIHLNEQLEKQIIDMQELIDELKEKSLSDDLKEKEKQSLFKIIAAICYDCYGYDHSQKKSPIPSEIVAAIASKLGESLDAETVRKWLGKAAECYPCKSVTTHKPN